MAKRKLKTFLIDGEEFADIVHMQSASGPQRIDIMMNTLTSAQGRKLAIWLLAAADEVDCHNRKRRKPTPPEGESE